MDKKEQDFTLGELQGVSFVKLAEELLGASVHSSEVLKKKPYSDETRQNAKLTLGYLNALLNAFKTKVQYVKVMDIDGKVKEMKKQYQS